LSLADLFTKEGHEFSSNEVQLLTLSFLLFKPPFPFIILMALPVLCVSEEINKHGQLIQFKRTTVFCVCCLVIFVIFVSLSVNLFSTALPCGIFQCQTLKNWHFSKASGIENVSILFT